MKISGMGQLLRIFVGESDKFKGNLIYNIIVLKAKELGIAGATVLKGIEGFGATSRIHYAKILSLSEELPVIIELVDVENRITMIREEIDKIFQESECGGLVTIENIQIIKYANGKK